MSGTDAESFIPRSEAVLAEEMKILEENRDWHGDIILESIERPETTLGGSSNPVGPSNLGGPFTLTGPSVLPGPSNAPGRPTSKSPLLVQVKLPI